MPSLNKNPRKFLKDWSARTFKFLEAACPAMGLVNLPSHVPLKDMDIDQLSDWSVELSRRLLALQETCALHIAHQSALVEQARLYRDSIVHLTKHLEAGTI